MQGSAVRPRWTPPTGTLGTLVRAAEARAAAVVAQLAALRDQCRDVPPAPPFAAALRTTFVTVIAEVKRASPSKGAIAPGLDATRQATQYEAGGAAAISVLTEPDRFGGSLADLRAVSGAVRLPVLRKDFLVHPVQLWEARAHGAAAALLIVRALSPSQLEEMLEAAEEAGVETLVEVRGEAELAQALALGARVVGVNNRDLETLEIDTATAPRLIRQIPSGVMAIAESGMRVPDDLLPPTEAGTDAVLIGSAVSAAADPEAAVRALATVLRIAR